MDIYSVIMAGGSGTRFWPASRANRPKQFLKVIGSKTLIEQTLERVKPICKEKNIIIVGNQKHHDILDNLLGERQFVILEEPRGCNTAPCIGLAAIYLRKNGITDSPMVILPADHFIANEAKFREIILLGCRLAQKGHIITIGIITTRQETGYGYLHKGAVKIEIEGVKVYDIRRFVEKPNQEDAQRYLRSGEYFWNGGIFIFTPEIILTEIEIHLPEVYKGLLEIEKSISESNYADVLHSVYQRFPSISIDYGVMEKTTHSILSIPGDFGWSDVGSWESLYALREKETDSNRNLIQGEKVFLFNTASTFIFNQSNQVVVSLGLKDIVIVNTDDALFVAPLKKSQDIKEVIEALRVKGLNFIL